MKATGVSIRGRIKAKSMRRNLMADVTLYIILLLNSNGEQNQSQTVYKHLQSVILIFVSIRAHVRVTPCVWETLPTLMLDECGFADCRGTIRSVRLSHLASLPAEPASGRGIFAFQMTDPYKMQSFHQLLR